MHESFQALLSLIIPDGVSDYFQLVSHNHNKENRSIHIYLEEINSITRSGTYLTEFGTLTIAFAADTT